MAPGCYSDCVGTYYLASSADGRDVAAFDLSASNLVPGDTNRQLDVFVHEMRAPAPRAGTHSSQGVFPGSITD